jgi:signal transduction histidine kinase
MEGTHETLIWHTETFENSVTQLHAVLITPSLLQKWTAQALQSDPHSNSRASLLDVTGESFFGDPATASSHSIRRTTVDTGLPWTVVLDSGNVGGESAEFASRRRLLGLGLASIILLLGSSGYFLWRFTEKDLAMARLQTDFVAAVSHEFRTPLTSIKHLTELLDEDDGIPPGVERDRRKAFYAALGRNAERLHRLVESLLDFSRMETGRKPWDFHSVDAGTFVGAVVSEFQKEVETRGFRIDFAVEDTGILCLRADAAALGHALWNLLDNAVKYSPTPNVVHVRIGHHAKGIGICVKDHGMGIPAHERHEVFRKFVRGEKASKLGIKGTGLGLAMVSHIVEAHGGTIELETEEGVGSTFRMVLPAEV